MTVVKNLKTPDLNIGRFKNFGRHFDSPGTGSGNPKKYGFKRPETSVADPDP
jgi:hypothetical protein